MPAACISARLTVFLAAQLKLTLTVSAIFGTGSALGQAVPASGGPVEATVIEDLVAASRILADQGVLDGFGHVSIRHPRDAGRLLMSRSLAPALTRAEDILEYHLVRGPVDARGRLSFLKRFVHCEVYKARPDVRSVIHTHSPGVIPFAASSVCRSGPCTMWRVSSRWVCMRG
jgi:ribulose-5-phosphate 4-epimerase/fuculose-1-phosphate aldolase